MTRTPSLIRRHRALSRLAMALACGVLLIPLLSGAAVAATPPITFDLMLGENCFTGTARLNSSVHLVVRNAAGDVIGRGIATVDQGGYWTFCDFYGVVRPGMTAKTTVYDRKGTIATRTIKVPQLSMRVDRDTDVAVGKGPAGKTVTLRLSDYRFDRWNESYGVMQPVLVDATGRYSYDFGADGIDVRGGAQGLIEWSDAANTVHVYRYAFAPYLSMRLDTPEIWGATRLNGHVSVTLRDGGSILATGHAVADWWSGAYWGLFSDADDEMYDLEGGAHLTATGLGSDVDWVVPSGITAVSKLSDVVSGKCFPNGRFLVSVTGRDWSEAADLGTAAPDGSFSIDFTPSMDITRNASVALECWTPSGDSVNDVYAVP